jgi:hypothetical protein
LLGGSSYTLTIDLNKTNILWAGSNVYWDGSKLTFKPAGYVGKENFYQGVLFKWGSMVGVSPAGAINQQVSASTPIYYPTSATAWSANNAIMNTLYGNGDYASILYITGALTPSPSNDYITSKTPAFEYEVSGEKRYFGDICRRIDPGYRLPRGEEFADGPMPGNNGWSNAAALAAVGWYKGKDKYGVDVVFPGIELETNKSDGTFVLDYDTYNGGAGAGFAIYNGAIFPAAGSYHNYISARGLGGAYHSSSSGTGDGDFGMGFGETALLVGTSSPPRKGAGTVRCLKNN